GAVLYEMATGRKVFACAGDSFFEIMQAQVETAPAPPIELNAAIPAALNAAILTALEKDPERRFADADAFRRAIEEPAQAVALALRPPKKSRRVWLVRSLQFAAAGAVMLLPLAFYEASRHPSPDLKIAPTHVQVRPAPAPVAVEPTPPVSLPISVLPAPSPDPPTVRPARKRIGRRAGKPDLNPRVIAEEHPPVAAGQRE